MIGQYDYIFRHYGVRPVVGGRVEHTVTGEFGTILKEADTHKHYVHVRFDGCDQPGLCHPLELDFLAPDEIEGASSVASFEEQFKMLGGAGDTASLDWATQRALIDEAVLACRARTLLNGGSDAQG